MEETVIVMRAVMTIIQRKLTPLGGGPASIERSESELDGEIDLAGRIDRQHRRW